jgi:succinylarginine dihydrolase
MAKDDPTLAALHQRLIENDESVPPARVAIALLRDGLSSGDDEKTLQALEAMVAIELDERAWWQMGNPGQPIAHWYRIVLKALGDEWRRAALVARDAADPELRAAARKSLDLLEPRA